MLKYKLNIKNKKDEFIEVQYESLFLSQDCTFITGVTDPSYGLSEEQTIRVISDRTIDCYLKANDVMRCGYVLYKKPYKVEDFQDVKGILYEDGKYHCVENINPSHIKEIPSITIDHHEYEFGYFDDNQEFKWFEYVFIPTKFWVYDEKVTIDNIVYDVIIENKKNMNNDDDYYPYIILNDLSKEDVDRILYVNDWEYSKRQLVTIFKIYNNNDELLHVKECNCIKQVPYFQVESETNVYEFYKDDFDTEEEFWDAMLKHNKELSYKWIISEDGDMVDLYISENVNDIPSHSFIEVTSLHSYPIKLISVANENGDIVFDYYNTKFQWIGGTSKDFAVVNEVEYEIFYYSDTVNKNPQPYIVFNLMPIMININSQKQTFKFNNSDEVFKIKNYKMIKIGDVFYKIKPTQSKENEYYVEVTKMPPFKLQIIKKFGNNVLRCIEVGTNNDSVLLSSMANSINDYHFIIKNTIFSSTLVEPLTDEHREYISYDLSFFINHNSIILPLKLDASNALNLHQDFLIKNNLVETKKHEIINRMVDMEKDIYYPAYMEKKGNQEILTLCHQLQFDLHFRTRDLSTWVVNDESATYVNNGGTIIENQQPNNWNLFDSYRYSTDTSITKRFQPTLKLKKDFQFFPPSDLLYFLNFTNEDVFYQKQKIGKSFLRLLFYDSPNPQNQNLLYSSTIFMSETLLYQKYINADKTKNDYVTIKERGYNREKASSRNTDIETTYTVDNSNYAKHIGVDTEPYDSKNGVMTFDEDKRLSSTFIIKNRNECVDSAEGFYLYLFKEYANGFHERSIYMRVQFNHAGEGKTINFMQMFNKQSNGDKTMINWSSQFNFEKHKDGYPLNELYEHLYIEIKVKYDIKNHRFCYYLPQWMSEKNSDKHTMRLNLFEVKIKDES